MKIAVVGLNYKTAPIEIREQLTLTGCALRSTLEDIKALTVASNSGTSDVHVVDEALILSTCNRLEIYSVVRDTDKAIAGIEAFLAKIQNTDTNILKPHLYAYTGDQAASHLMEVACGLNSMILGETQILGQVTGALDNAFDAGTVGPGLSHLFSQSIHAGKRARTETIISRHTTSVSHAGAQLLTAQFNAPANISVLIIGAGEMAVLAAQALQRLGVHNLTFMNRTYVRAEEMAIQFNSKAMVWSDIDIAIAAADAIICCTGAPHVVLTKNDIERAQLSRKQQPLTIMDIAVPRDVENTCGTIPGVKYFDIDDLQSVVDSNIELRRSAMPAVRAIIAEEIVRFNGWISSREVTPVITDLRSWAQAVADQELETAMQKLGHLDDKSKRVVARMAHRIINRFLHEPTHRLRDHAHIGNAEYFTNVVRELFPLDELTKPVTNASSRGSHLDTSRPHANEGQVA